MATSTGTQPAAQTRGQWRSVDAINLGKAVNILMFAVCVYMHGGLHNMRQTLYLGLHGSYVFYWFWHQIAVPDYTPFAGTASALSSVPVGVLIAGLWFGWPVFLAFSNPHEISPWWAVLCMLVFSTGNFLNVGADWYKAGAKKAGGGLVSTGPYTWSMRPNYLGDWIRYLSFAMVSGRAVCFLVPFVAVFFNVASMPGHIESGKKRYGAAFLDYASQVPAIVPGMGPAVSRAEADKSKAGAEGKSE